MGEQRKNRAMEEGGKDKFQGDDPGVTPEVGKAIVGAEARRGIPDEKAAVPARSKRRWQDVPEAQWRIPEAVHDKRPAAVVADKRSKEGNDDTRLRGAHRQEAEERKTPTNERPLRGSWRAEDSHAARKEELRPRARQR